MGSEKVPINESQEMKNKKITTTEQKVVYSGRYAVVAEGGVLGLMACPREIPEQDEGDYLLNMIDELRDVYGKAFKGGRHGGIYINALVKHGGEWHGLVVDKGGKVRIIPWVIDYEDFVRTADKVMIWVAGREIEGFFDARYGRYAVVLEGKEGLLYAYARRGVKLGQSRLMLEVIREVMNGFDDLRKWRNIKAVVVQGLVRRKNADFRPVVYGRDDVRFMWANNNYTDFVKTAEEVKFTRQSC